MINREFNFYPQPDITTAELARVVQWLLITSSNGGPHALMRNEKEMEAFQASEIFRHFREVT